jgi:uncharacterized phage-associated protein
MTLTFSHRKATQALNFFARKAGGQINKMKALKLIFFADRYHLRQYGRPITNDEYFAMKLGPVPSGCKDLAEMSDFLDPQERAYAARFLQRVSQYDFASVAEVDRVVFSQTDVEALEFAWTRFGQCEPFELANDITHKFPEWKRHETALQSPDVSRIPMSYRHFLDNAPASIDAAPPLSADDRRLRAEEIEELQAIESLWA